MGWMRRDKDEPTPKPPVAEAPPQSEPPTSERPPIQVESDKDQLPVFYQTQGLTNFLGRANEVDPDYRYRWIQISAKNQQVKKMKGWEPVESREVIDRLEFDHVLINAKGRVQWGDVELWRMPRGRADAIRKHINDRTTRRTTSVQARLKEMAAEVAGQTGNAVSPFVGGGREDVFARVPYKGE